VTFKFIVYVSPPHCVPSTAKIVVFFGVTKKVEGTFCELCPSPSGQNQQDNRQSMELVRLGGKKNVTNFSPLSHDLVRSLHKKEERLN